MRRVLLVGLLVLFGAGCSDDSTGPSRTVQIVGTYTLESINGNALPYVFHEFPGAYLMHQVSGSFVLNADRTYQENALLREYFNTPGGITWQDIPVSLAGTWQAEDSVLLVTQTDNGATGFGFISGNRLTLSFEVSDSLYTYIYNRD
ncbi:MAG TPA: hypothetical protein VGD27_12885 [Longimicrobiales bacterium]